MLRLHHDCHQDGPRLHVRSRLVHAILDATIASPSHLGKDSAYSCFASVGVLSSTQVCGLVSMRTQRRRPSFEYSLHADSVGDCTEEESATGMFFETVDRAGEDVQALGKFMQATDQIRVLDLLSTYKTRKC